MRIAIRADASPLIGTGHVMRCLTLADALRAKGGEIQFLARHLPESLESLVRSKGHGLIRLEGLAEDPLVDGTAYAEWLGTSQRADAAECLRAFVGASWDWLVVDHYALDKRWESTLRNSVRKILVIDDLADRYHDCDALLDQNLYDGMERRYDGKVPSDADLYLGPRYALLRPEFGAARVRIRPRTDSVRNILIAFGGVDAENHTGQAIEAAAALGAGIQVDVVIGDGHPARARILQRCGELGFRCHVQTHHMADLMAIADLAIGAAGSMTWERCCLGLPAIAFPVAANQERLAEDAGAAGLIWAAPPRPDVATVLRRDLPALLGNGALRRHISLQAHGAVDGRGTDRIVSRLGLHGVIVDRAHGTLSSKLYSWRNDPAIRAVSRDSRPISWEAHQRWFEAVLGDPDRELLIGRVDGKEAGVVRFDIEGDSAEVSIYLVPDAPDLCSGRDLLQAAQEWILEQRPALKRIKAEVLEGNHASHGLFRSSGYDMTGAAYTKRIP